MALYSMDKLIFTRHALEKLAERKISKQMVESTIRAPMKLITDSGKFYAFRQFGKTYLKVIFVRVGGSIKVITQYFVDSLL